MGVQKIVAFGRRHVWPVSAMAVAAILASLCGIVLAVEAMTRGWVIWGYLGGAACGDLLVWGAVIMAALWLPARSAPTS